MLSSDTNDTDNPNLVCIQYDISKNELSRIDCACPACPTCQKSNNTKSATEQSVSNYYAANTEATQTATPSWMGGISPWMSSLLGYPNPSVSNPAQKPPSLDSRVVTTMTQKIKDACSEQIKTYCVGSDDSTCLDTLAYNSSNRYIFTDEKCGTSIGSVVSKQGTWVVSTDKLSPTALGVGDSSTQDVVARMNAACPKQVAKYCNVFDLDPVKADPARVRNCLTTLVENDNNAFVSNDAKCLDAVKGIVAPAAAASTITTRPPTVLTFKVEPRYNLVCDDDSSTGDKKCTLLKKSDQSKMETRCVRIGDSKAYSCTVVNASNDDNFFRGKNKIQLDTNSNELFSFNRG